jgi:hypothetical protein
VPSFPNRGIVVDTDLQARPCTVVGRNADGHLLHTRRICNLRDEDKLEETVLQGQDSLAENSLRFWFTESMIFDGIESKDLGILHVNYLNSTAYANTTSHTKCRHFS